MTNGESKFEFRFELAKILLLAEIFAIVNKFVCPIATERFATKREAFCVAVN